MKSAFRFIAAGMVAAGALVGGHAAAQTVGLATLPPGAINNLQGQAVAKVVQENSDLQMRVVSFNSPSAILGATQANQTEFSYTSNDESGAALHGKDEYEGRAMEDLRVAVTVFPFKVGILVRADSGIETVADLEGKRFPIGWQGFQQGIPLSNAMLATGGLSLEDTDGVATANLLRAADDFKAGRLDATIFAVGAPKMQEIDAAVGGIKFLDLPDSPEAEQAMAAVRPEYHLAEQKPAPHIAGVEDETTLMEYAIVLLTNKDTDEDVVYKTVKAIYENIDDLKAAHPSFNAMTQEGLATPQPRLEYHPGAIKFFKEAGVWQGE